MCPNETHGNESIARRTERALTECMTVLPEGGEIYTVVGENGSTYRVDSREGRCTCPDHQHRDVRCKHIRRVAFATGERPVPGSVDGVDDHLGEQVDGSPQVLAADGGIIDAGDDGELLDERPADCDCAPFLGDLPCWPCYREGFDAPNPNAERDD